MRSLSCKTLMILFVAAVCVSAARAQQQTDENRNAPIPAYRSPLANLADNGEATNDDSDVVPDNRPLTGVQLPSVGTLRTTRNYWQPHVDIVTIFDSNPLSTTGNRGWVVWNSGQAGIDLHRTTLDSNLNLSVSGGGMIATNNTTDYGLTNLSLNYSRQYRRWTFLLVDEMNYLPEVTFGFMGISGPVIPGPGPGQLNPGVTPDQSILTPQGQRFANTVVGQADFSLTSRTSITVAGAYSLMRFFENNDLFDVDGTVFQGGLNHRVSPKTTVGALYQYEQFGYGGSQPSVADHAFELAWERVLTSRLAARITGGPALALYSVSPPAGGSGASTRTSAMNWGLNSSLVYKFERSKVGLSYFHGVVGGSGFLVGAIGDRVYGTFDRRVTRLVAASFFGGYDRSEPLNGGVGPATTFNGILGGASLSRMLGRTLGVSVLYQGQYETSNLPFCLGTVCKKALLRNEISLGFSWHALPKSL